MSKKNEADALSDRRGLEAGLERPVAHPPGVVCPGLGYGFTVRRSSTMLFFTVKKWIRKCQSHPW